MNKFYPLLGKRRFTAMCFRFIVLIAFLVLPFLVVAQSGIPVGTCGLQYTYDAGGNMIERSYVCNNSTTALQESRIAIHKYSTTTFQGIDAIYPNPTNGRFSIRMLQPLQQAVVTLIDVQGKALQTKEVSGTQIQMDISSLASGVYFLNINDHGSMYKAKVVKR